MEEEKIQNPKVENGEVVQTQQSLNVAKDLQNKKLMKKGMFITGLVFFALVVVMFITICCYKGMITDLGNSAEGTEQIAVALVLVVLLTIFPIFLLPMLIFFVVSVVLLALCRKSTSKKIRIASQVCMWIDVALFVTMAILLTVWILV